MRRMCRNVLTICGFFALAGNIPSVAQTPPYLDPTVPVDQRVDDLLGRMTLDEKIGQMMQVDHTNIAANPGLVTTYFIGSVLSGGDSKTGDNTTPAWADLYDTLQARALSTRLKIPIIYGIDAVHGNSGVYGTTVFPHNIGLGCTRDSALVAQAARVTAVELSATGIDWTFGPCVAVPRDERWGRTYEGFGETPELAVSFGVAAVRGLQGDSLAGATSVVACAKHYLGDGGTLGGVDQGNTVADEATIRAIHLPAYAAAKDGGVGSVMASFSSINGEKVHGSGYWLNTVLKSELGFNGFVISDWAGIDQLGGDYTECVQKGVNAGIDMVMLPHRYNDFLLAMRTLVNGGQIAQTRLDDAVRRILTAKFRKGLFERPFVDRSLFPLVGSAGHREVARQCVRQSVVVLKKKDGILPLSKRSARILVAGSHADNLGYQCGGWSIRWQGGSGAITQGATLLEAMRAAAPTAVIDYSPTGEFADTAGDASVVVVGELPYAEGLGDRSDLAIPSSDVELMKRMKSLGHPLVLIVVTGRPLIIEPAIHFSDAIVVAWLPGTEGTGVADVLFGDFTPTGRLSHTWPKTMTQIPINAGDGVYEPLYPYGYGIASLEDSPRGSSPVVESAIVGKDGSFVEATFNKPMVNPAERTADFVLTRDGLPFHVTTTQSLKPGDSTTIVLQLDSAYRRQQVVTLAYQSGTLGSADGGVLNPFGPRDVYNWATPAAVAVPGWIDGENYTAMAGLSQEATTDTGRGVDLIDFDGSDWLEYLITVRSAGYYRLKLRIASESQTGSLSLSSGGRNLGVVNLPVTGSSHSWTTVAQTVGLLAGEQTMRLSVLAGGFRLHWLSIEDRVTSADTDTPLPVLDAAEHNYPNPFNPTTTVTYSVGAPGRVTVTIIDALGRPVRTLVDRDHLSGPYAVTWDGTDEAGHPVSSGAYLYEVRGHHSVHVRKMMLVR